MRLVSLIFLLCSLSCTFAQDKADPDPHRFSGSFASFAKQDRDRPFEKGGIVFVGSSSVRMLDIPKYFPGIVALNRGFGGAHISDVNHYLEQAVLQYEPGTVVFFCGGNDLWSDKSPAQVRADFDEFTRRLFDRVPNAKLIVLATRPSPRRIRIIEQEHKLNTLFKAAADLDERVTSLEGSAARFLNEAGKPRTELYAKDQLHMNHAGYLIWGEIIRPHLISIIGNN